MNGEKERLSERESKASEWVQVEARRKWRVSEGEIRGDEFQSGMRRSGGKITLC